MVEFELDKFTGLESSEFIEVVVRVKGGISRTPITVILTPSEQSPVSSAIGMYIRIYVMNMNVSTVPNDYCIIKCDST